MDPEHARSMPRRIAPAIALLFLSPLIAEFLLGNIAIDQLASLTLLAPMYGGGALLVREVTRRAGRGWPTMILLGLAYAVFEEGLIVQTLFNPSYLGHDLISATHLPALGMGAWWTVFVLTLHTIWSTSVAIALSEALVARPATQPWLGRVGLAVATALLILGAVGNFFVTYSTERFVATGGQLAGAAAVVVVLAVAAFLLPQRPAPTGDAGPAPNQRSAPRPWVVGGVTLVAASLFMAPRDIQSWFTVAGWLLLFVVFGIVLVRWSRARGWDGTHRLAVAGGALLTYAWVSFPMRPVLGATGTLDLIGNTVFALAAVGLLAGCWRRTLAQRRGSPGRSASASQR
jgi:hypothetical protein